MKYLFIIFLFLLPMVGFNQTIKNKSCLPIQIRIWKNSKVTDEFNLNTGQEHGIPSYVIFNPFKQEYLLQFRFLSSNIETQIPNSIKQRFQFDGLFFNVLVNDDLVKRLGPTKTYLIGIDIEDLFFLTRA